MRLRTVGLWNSFGPNLKMPGLEMTDKADVAHMTAVAASAQAERAYRMAKRTMVAVCAVLVFEVATFLFVLRP